MFVVVVVVTWPCRRTFLMETNGKNEIMITETITRYYAARQRLLDIHVSHHSLCWPEYIFSSHYSCWWYLTLDLPIPLTEPGNQVEWWRIMWSITSRWSDDHWTVLVMCAQVLQIQHYLPERLTSDTWTDDCRMSQVCGIDKLPPLWSTLTWLTKKS